MRVKAIPPKGIELLVKGQKLRPVSEHMIEAVQRKDRNQVELNHLKVLGEKGRGEDKMTKEEKAAHGKVV